MNRYGSAHTERKPHRMSGRYLTAARETLQHAITVGAVVSIFKIPGGFFSAPERTAFVPSRVCNRRMRV